MGIVPYRYLAVLKISRKFGANCFSTHPVSFRLILKIPNIRLATMHSYRFNRGSIRQNIASQARNSNKKLIRHEASNSSQKKDRKSTETHRTPHAGA